MKNCISILLYLLLITSSIMYTGCSSPNLDVGDIPFNKELDEASFKLCNPHKVKQYYVRHSSDIPPGYTGEKRGLEKEIFSQYKQPLYSGQDGYITIRFIVNCKGSTGRFRMEEMSPNYEPFKFEKEITDDLLKIVKGLSGWIPRRDANTSFDYYQYLTFKMESGQIMKIMP